MVGAAAQTRPNRLLLQAINGTCENPDFRIASAISRTSAPTGGAALPSSYLAATLQIAQRRARLVRGTRLNRDRRDLASLDESEKLPQILDRTDVRALDVIILNGNNMVEIGHAPP